MSLGLYRWVAPLACAGLLLILLPSALARETPATTQAVAEATEFLKYEKVDNGGATLKAAIVSRIKIMSQLDIAERRLPQDGRIKLKLGKGREMDFRVSVLPTMWGEKVVLRLLDKGNLQLDMTKLGFEEK